MAVPCGFESFRGLSDQFFGIFNIHLDFMCMGDLYHLYIPGACGGQKRKSDALGLELQL